MHFSKLMSFFSLLDASHYLSGLIFPRMQTTVEDGSYTFEPASPKKDSQPEILLDFQTVVYALVGVFGDGAGGRWFLFSPVILFHIPGPSAVPDTEAKLSRCLMSESEEEVRD